ncbi:hypothetical protein ABMA27_000356 [Loxostege sticticalis]|uniref:FLYWCH-type domain-containing protein n=1 Tax=Loxostege sticticalis TaxID=481309 RepID=A0ABR3IN64_LOXSC
MESTSSTSENDSQNPFTIIPSQRGGKLLLYDGYRYNFKRKNQNGHTVWICSVKNTCSASLKTIYKHRNKVLQAKRLHFSRIKDLIITNIYKDFLFADYHHKKSRIILFASKEGRKILKEAKEIPDFESEVITSDFEIGIINAIREIHPNTITPGCLFHFSQAIWRHSKKHGLTKSKLCKAHVRRCIALSYLPLEYRDDGWLYWYHQTAFYDCFIDKRGFNRCLTAV